MRKFILFFLLMVFAAPVAHSASLYTDRLEAHTDILAYASWLVDPSGFMDITRASSQEEQSKYEPLHSGFPAKASGAGWLRVELAKNAPVMGTSLPINDQPLLLSFGELPPGTAMIYYKDVNTPAQADAVWFAAKLRAYEQYALPEPPLNGMVVYIHFEETPGLWFNPTIQRGQDTNGFMIPPDIALPGFLLVGILVCLLRAIKDKAVWPLWAAMLLGLVLLQVLIPLPVTNKPFDFKDLPILLAPGLCLLLYPHLGRLLLRPAEYSPFQDSLLKLMYLIGVVVCLIPLVPGFTWITRLYPLWCLLLLPLLPACVGALTNKRPGALFFTGAVVLPALGACWSLWALLHPPVHPSAQYGGLWGMAVGGICFFMARIPKTNALNASQTTGKDDALTLDSPVLHEKDKGTPFETLGELTVPPVSPKKEASSGLEPLELLPVTDTGKTSTSYQQDPLLVILEDSERKIGTSKPFSLQEVQEQKAETEQSVVAESADITLQEAATPLEEDKEEQPETVVAKDASMQETTVVLDKKEPVAEAVPQPQTMEEKLPDLSFSSPENTMVDKADTLPHEADLRPTRIISLKDDEFDNEDWMRQATLHYSPIEEGKNNTFNLSSLVRTIYDTILPQAESKGIFLSWFIAPTLPALVKGDAYSLQQTLSLLLQNALEATNKGAVQLSIRQDSSTIAGQEKILFCITDTGAAQRADSGLFHAWQLAQRTGGSFSIEYAPHSGTMVIFSIGVSIPEAVLPQEESLESSSQEDPGQDNLTQANHSQRNSSNDTLPSEEAPVTLGSDSGMPAASGSSAIASSSDEIRAESKETSMETPTAERNNLSLEASSREAEEPLGDEGIAPSIPRFIITDMTISNRRLIAHYLADILQVSLEATSMEHAVSIFKRTNASLVIYDADSPERDIIDAITAMNAIQKNRGQQLVPQFVITGHDVQAARMMAGGATQTLVKPFSQEDFLERIFKAVPSLQRLSSLPELPKEASVRTQAAQKTVFSASPAPAEEGNKPDSATTNSTAQVIPDWADEAVPLADAAPQHEASLQSAQADIVEQVNTEGVAPMALTSPEPNENVTPESSEEAELVSPFGPMPSGNYPLPGIEGESIDIVMLPLIPGLLHTLSDALADSLKAREEHQTLFVQEAANRLGAKAETFGLLKLGKIARCLERAAEADDFEAVDALLEDLEKIVTRYMESLEECYHVFLSEARE